MKHRKHPLSFLEMIKSDVAFGCVVGIAAHVNSCGTVDAIRFVACDAHQNVDGMAVVVVSYDHAPHHRRCITARHPVRHWHQGEQKYDHRALKPNERVSVEWIGDSKDDVPVSRDFVYHARLGE